MSEKLTQEHLKELLEYSPDTGVFRWKVDRTGSAKAGSVAGCEGDDGYLRIRVDGKDYLAHRLAWLYTHGYFPEHQIDHLNGDRLDNRLENLREVSKFCNMQNTKVRSDNKTGFPGVSWYKPTKKYVVKIYIHNKQYNLGYYQDPLEAALARLTAELDDPRWTCNYRSELIKSIKKAWPEFELRYD